MSHINNLLLHSMSFKKPKYSVTMHRIEDAITFRYPSEFWFRHVREMKKLYNFTV